MFGSDIFAGPIWPLNENLLSLQQGEIYIMLYYIVHESFNLNCKTYDPLVMWLGPIRPHIENV